MQTMPNIRIPRWNEKRVLKCKNCGRSFFGRKILFYTKCPSCGSHRIEEDRRILY